jgi:DNA processing protein
MVNVYDVALKETTPDVIKLKYIHFLISKFGSTKNVWEANDDVIKSALSFNPMFSSYFITRRKVVRLEDCQENIKNLELLKDVKLVSFSESTYPSKLKRIEAAPLVLYIKGTLFKEYEKSVAIAGTREASFYGLSMARKIANELAKNGFSIVSGLARGIDKMAHLGALEADGRTIGVLGQGFTFLYPREHKELAEDILKKGGALVSEHAPNIPPTQFNFLYRNRITSGLSDAVILIEGSEKSGTKSQARFALEQNKKLFILVPKDLERKTSYLYRKLMEDNLAIPVESAKDVLDNLK